MKDIACPKNKIVKFDNLSRDEYILFKLGKETERAESAEHLLTLESASSLQIFHQPKSGVISISLLNKFNDIIDTKELSIGTEKTIVSAYLDYENKKLVFVCLDDTTIECDISDLIDTLHQEVEAEKTRAIEKETELEEDISTEETRAKEAEQALTTRIAAEENTRGVEITRVEGLISTEATTARAAESSLSTAIEQEVSDRESEISRVESLLSQEVTRAQQVEGNLSTSITSETTRAQGAESILRTDLATEVARATAAENALDSSKVDKEEGKSLMSSEEHSKLAGISAEANKVVVLGSTPNGYIVIDGTETNVYDDTEIRELIAAKETGWVIDTKSQITGTEDSLGNFTNVTVIGSLDLSLLKVGDNVYVKDPTTPDYWISGKTGSGTTESPYIFNLNVLDTKIDLSNYYTKPEILALLNDKADKTTVNAIDTRLTTAEGTITTIDGRVSAIEDDYLKAADKIALTALITAETTRATDAEFAITQRLTTAESDISSLKGRVTTVETGVSAIKNKPAYNITSTQISNWDNEVGAKALAQTKSTVSVSESGTSTEEIQYITVDGVEKKIKGIEEEIPEILENFGDNSPEAIAYAFDNNLVPDTWSIGDEIEIKLLNNEKFIMRLAHMSSDLYDFADGSGKTPYVLEAVNLLSVNKEMNLVKRWFTDEEDNNIEGWNAGGWNYSFLRTWLNTDFIDMLPFDWKECLAKVKIPYMNGGYQSGVKLCYSEDKVFLPNHREIYGDSPSGWEAEDNKDVETQWDIYADNGVDLENYTFCRKYKIPAENNGKDDDNIPYGSWYWCRGCGSSVGNGFLDVFDGGFANYAHASFSGGVSPCLCLSLKHN